MSSEVIIPEILDNFESRFVPKHIREMNQAELDERFKRANDKKYKESYCQDLIDHMAKGFRFNSFAGIIGVSPRTTEKWLERRPEFREAYELAKAASILYWEQKGLEALDKNPKEFNTKLFETHLKWHGHYKETTTVENTFEVRITDPNKLNQADLDKRIKELEASIKGHSSDGE